jgi:hypothetical protein
MGGRILVEGLDVGSVYRGEHFAGVPVRIRVIPASGASFRGWDDGGTEPERVVTPWASGLFLTARCERKVD